MARPLKDGIDYFSKDTDFYEDDKIKVLRADFGAKGMYLLDYLLCEIYGKSGYYMGWDDRKCSLVSDGARCDFTPGFVKEFVNACLSEGFFNKELATACGILTSAGIQRRYIRGVGGRDAIYLIEEYMLLDKTSEKDYPKGTLKKCTFKSLSLDKNGVSMQRNSINLENNPQKKRKESKGKEKKEEAPDEPELSPAAAALFSFYQKNMAVPLSPMTMEKLLAWMNDVDVSLIEYAIEQAVGQNKRTWAYVEAILNNHANAGRKTRAEAEGSKSDKSDSAKSSIKPTKFSNFSDIHDYDFDTFERKSLGEGEQRNDIHRNRPR